MLRKFNFFYYGESTWILSWKTICSDLERCILLLENHMTSEIKFFFLRDVLPLVLEEIQSLGIKK